VQGRRCARLGIQQLGLEAQPILAGPKREPLWPTGVVGAITHTHGFAAAAVARSSDLHSLGVDAEPDEPLPKGVLKRISHNHEQEWIAAGVAGVAAADRLLFCIKEAVYKTWFPVAQVWLGFEDALVEIHEETQSFGVTITAEGPISDLAGRYQSADGIVMAAIELSH
jgi:4'-phosphopantetheinyl transferase EntD